MSTLIVADPIITKLEKQLQDYGFTTSIPQQRLDFEEYADSHLLGQTSGIGNLGTIQIRDSPISYINVLKKQEMVKCNFAVGGYAGMGVHMHSWLKIRWFMSFPMKLEIGPLNMGTLTTIKKGIIRSEVEDYVWSGYQKLTSLPPGLLRDNVADALDKEDLRSLMKKCLLKERIVIISRYDPEPDSSSIKTNSKIVIESKWKLQRDAYPDSETIHMYERIAENIRQTIHKLQYHLKSP